MTETQKGINSFLEAFNGIKEEILKAKDALVEQSKNGQVIEVNDFEPLFDKVQEMKKLLADSTVLLPVYEISQAQKAIENMEALLVNEKNTIIPKKKFSFKSKKATTQLPTAKESKKEETETKAKKIIVDTDETNIGNKSNETIDSHSESYRSLRLFSLENCTVLTGAVSGSIFIDDCRNCKFYLASQQIRIHTSTDCDFYLHVKSNPIIEHCSKLRFAPHLFEYPEKETQFKAANFDVSVNNWSKVEDFNWLKATASPNWSILPENEQIKRSL